MIFMPLVSGYQGYQENGVTGAFNGFIHGTMISIANSASIVLDFFDRTRRFSYIYSEKTKCQQILNLDVQVLEEEECSNIVSFEEANYLNTEYDTNLSNIFSPSNLSKDCDFPKRFVMIYRILNNFIYLQYYSTKKFMLYLFSTGISVVVSIANFILKFLIILILFWLRFIYFIASKFQHLVISCFESYISKS